MDRTGVSGLDSLIADMSNLGNALMALVFLELFLIVPYFFQWRRDRQIARQKSPANLGNLPAEIILLIVNHLKPPLISQLRNDSDLEGTDSDWKAVELSDPERPRGQLTCCQAETEVDNGSKVTRIASTDDSLQLSAVLKRLREMIFLGGQMRRRRIRICQWWIEETKRVPLEARSRYTSLVIIAHPMHTVNRMEQLVDMLQCFPQVERLRIIWGIFAPSGTMSPIDPRIANTITVQGLDQLTVLDIRVGLEYHQRSWTELDAILTELRIPNVKKLSIWLQDVFFCDVMKPNEFIEIQRVFSHIAYKALDNFNLTLEYIVRDLPASCPWAALEEIIATVAKEHPVAILSVRPGFYSYNAHGLESTLFTQTEDTVTLHSEYMPTEERLLQWVDRLRALDPNLERFQLEMRFDGSLTDGSDHKHFYHRGSMLQLEYAKSGEFTIHTCEESHKHLTVIRPMPNATTSENTGCAKDSMYRYAVCRGHVKW